ncbi:hypothetical protein M3Y94_00187200 [Aphelenchoides besseyi]|nr:hypothetical protein M3Y94_00187200 [Aphelenchoides besseyi]KAI6236828.1 hypothetical protein M3Y95_00200000 [Aphelenchoides besseyi]
MFSKALVCVLVAVCALELAIACAPSSSQGSATTAASAQSSTAAARRRRSTSSVIELNSNVPPSNAGVLIEKLRAASIDLDAAKYGAVEHEQSTDSNGNVVFRVFISQPVDCADLRQTTQKVVKKVSEVSSAKISCDGQEFQV